MQELMWYALSHGVTRPVPSQDVPLWFAALLVFGLLWASALIGSGVTQWYWRRRDVGTSLMDTARPR
jgi:hypothetical protein